MARFIKFAIAAFAVARGDDMDSEALHLLQTKAKSVISEQVDGDAASEGTGNEILFQVKVTPESQPQDVKIVLHPEWAPVGVTRFQELVKSAFFNDAAIFRVVPGFIVQFGLPATPQPEPTRLQDDAVQVSNKRGTLVFATAGPGTRTSQMFINLGNNGGLDRQGFAPIGEVTLGMNIIDKINPQYGEKPDQSMIQDKGNSYLDQEFPRLSKIASATFL